MDKVQKHNSFSTNTPSSESYKKKHSFIQTMENVQKLSHKE